jgi:hypothetical protein
VKRTPNAADMRDLGTSDLPHLGNCERGNDDDHLTIGRHELGLRNRRLSPYFRLIDCQDGNLGRSKQLCFLQA